MANKGKRKRKDTHTLIRLYVIRLTLRWKRTEVHQFCWNVKNVNYPEFCLVVVSFFVSFHFSIPTKKSINCRPLGLIYLVKHVKCSSGYFYYYYLEKWYVLFCTIFVCVCMGLKLKNFFLFSGLKLNNIKPHIATMKDPLYDKRRECWSIYAWPR